MPDIAALNIIYVNIDSIEAQDTQRENCNTNISNVKMSNAKQETRGPGECCRNTDDSLKKTKNDNGSVGNTNTNTLTNYFLSFPNLEIDKRKSTEHKKYNVYKNVLNVIGCFEGTFSLQLKPDSKPYQAPSRCVGYALQKPFKDKLDQLQ